MKKIIYLGMNIGSAIGLLCFGYSLGKKKIMKSTKFVGDMIVEEAEVPENPPYIYLALNDETERLKNCDIVKCRVIRKK